MSTSERGRIPTPADDDPRLAFVYQEAVRGLQHQQYVVESLNTRGGNLIFAPAFATSLLGTKGLSDGVGFWDWIAVSLLFLVGALIVFILWPYYNFTFRFDPEELLAQFVDRDSPATMSAMHRALAVRIKADMTESDSPDHPTHSTHSAAVLDRPAARDPGMARIDWSCGPRLVKNSSARPQVQVARGCAASDEFDGASNRHCALELLVETESEGVRRNPERFDHFRRMRGARRGRDCRHFSACLKPARSAGTSRRAKFESTNRVERRVRSELRISASAELSSCALLLPWPGRLCSGKSCQCSAVRERSRARDERIGCGEGHEPIAARSAIDFLTPA